MFQWGVVCGAEGESIGHYIFGRKCEFCLARSPTTLGCGWLPGGCYADVGVQQSIPRCFKFLFQCKFFLLFLQIFTFYNAALLLSGSTCKHIVGLVAQKCKCSISRYIRKRIVHPKIPLLSLFNHPHVIRNLYMSLKSRYFDKCLSGVHTVEVNGGRDVWLPNILQNIFVFCRSQSYRFDMT